MTASLFQFDGNWSFPLALPGLAALNHESFLPRDPQHALHDQLQRGFIGVTIEDAHTSDPDPLPEQVQAIHWLQQNEAAVLQTLFVSLRDVIYPYYKALMDADGERFPPLETIADLKRAIGVPAVEISTWHREGLAYMSLSAKFSADAEHGLCFILHGNRLVDYGDVGGVDSRRVAEDCGVDYESFLDRENQRDLERELQLYTPHPKYGKLKPWQEQANHYYPFGLLHNNRPADLKQYLEAHPEIVQQDGARLLAVAVLHNRHEIIDLLLPLPLPTRYPALIQAVEHTDSTLMQRIINAGADVNEAAGNRSALYYLVWKYNNCINDNLPTDACDAALEVLIRNGLNPNLADQSGNTTASNVMRIKNEAVRERVLQLVNKKKE